MWVYILLFSVYFYISEMVLCIAGILCKIYGARVGPKTYEAQDTNGFSNGLLFVRSLKM
jgi:hypothetical protein